MWYNTLGGLALSVVILFLGSFFVAGGATCTGSGCGLVSPLFLASLIIVVVLLVLVYPVLYWYLFSYELSERTITVNSGILFRQYESIDFGRVQTVDNERGPLLWFFGLTMVKIWTASADQLAFSVGKGSSEARPHPDTMLILDKDAAQALKDFIMRSKTAPSGL